MNPQNQLPTAILDNSGLALTAGWLTIYTIEPIQREYQQVVQEYLPEGVGLPALSYLDAPPVADQGMAVVRNADGTAWEVVTDYRGQTVYHTATGQPERLTTLGPLDAELTLQAPVTPHDTWNGQQWVTDTAAQQAAEVASAKNELLQRQRIANEQIALLADAVELGMATEAESAALLAWKTYRVLLSRVDIQNTPDIDWPVVPVSTAD
ncbi:phage tail protein [Serratia sp. S1B]|nr:phage tail protein [Serratia sp. S1B]